jgi:hypothetical protein
MPYPPLFLKQMLFIHDQKLISHFIVKDIKVRRYCQRGSDREVSSRTFIDTYFYKSYALVLGIKGPQMMNKIQDLPSENSEPWVKQTYN